MVILPLSLFFSSENNVGEESEVQALLHGPCNPAALTAFLRLHTEHLSCWAGVTARCCWCRACWAGDLPPPPRLTMSTWRGVVALSYNPSSLGG